MVANLDGGMEVKEELVQNEPVTFTIPDTETGATVDPVKLGLRGWRWFVLTCEDCDNVQASTDVAVWVNYDGGDTMLALTDTNDPGSLKALGNLPTTGTFCHPNYRRTRGA